jgi:hypothetical protein
VCLDKGWVALGQEGTLIAAATSYRPWCEIVLDVVSGIEPNHRTSVLSAAALEAYEPLRRAARAKDS